MKVDLTGPLRTIAVEPPAIQHEPALRALGAELAVAVARTGMIGDITLFKPDRVIVRLWRFVGDQPQRQQVGWECDLAEIEQHRDMSGYARMVLKQAVDKLLQEDRR